MDLYEIKVLYNSRPLLTTSLDCGTIIGLSLLANRIVASNGESEFSARNKSAWGYLKL